MTGPGKRLAIAATACAVMIAVAGDAARACTTFALKTPRGTFFGRNYDFMIGHGMLVTNKRGVAKQAVPGPVKDTPARWVSRFGSLTFNQFGRELPQGGMNEAGLVVELMWLDATKYPAVDDRPAVNELSWIQYMLDTSSTVDEVQKQAGRIRINGIAPVHFLVADKSGATASFEFIDGKLVVHRGESMPATVLTNDSYAASTEYLRKYQGFGGREEPRGGPASLDRFCRAATKVKAYLAAPTGSPVDYAFGILSDVAQGKYTRWSIVYDTATLTVHFRTLEHPETRRVSLGSFDFACSTPVRVLDLDSPGTGDVSAKFADYTMAVNRNLIGRSFSGVSFLKDTPVAALDQYAAYPESLPCAR